MEYRIIYLRPSSSRKITDYLLDFLVGRDFTFRILSARNCSVTRINYLDLLCEKNIQTTLNVDYTVDKTNAYSVVTKSNYSYLIVATPKEEKRLMIVFYQLPNSVFQFDSRINYRQWVWGQSTPNLILIPNLKNDSSLYVKIKLKQFKVLAETQMKNYRDLNVQGLEATNIIHPDINFRLYLDSRFPITVYDRDLKPILGEIINQSSLSGITSQELEYIERSKVLSLDPQEEYFISCNDVISRKTQPLIKLSIGVYEKERLIYSDYMIFRIAPALLCANNLEAKSVYMAKLTGSHNNTSFVTEATKILNSEGIESVIIENQTISSYHRWMQDILKFVYCTDGQKTQFMLLKGPHFASHTQKNGDLSYIYKAFADYPMYDFFYDTDKNLDAFGNVQILPPILPQYPFGRIIYGTSPDNLQQSNISYNLVDFLESQQIQKPIHVNTSWLSVGHVDEVLSYVPDPQSKLGFRILIASPKKFLDLIQQLSSETVIFDNKDNYYVFDEVTPDVKQRFTLKSGKPDQFPCVFKSQLKVGQILNWKEIRETNVTYQKYLDDIRKVVMKELGLGWSDFYEVPIYYWPKSIAFRARSIMPNMINNLYLTASKPNYRGFMLVPKPFEAETNDKFESYFKSLLPTDVKPYFIRNWDSYYLLEGDINCGTNARRVASKKSWWTTRPEGAYNIE
jgi:hypothetical protein